MPFARSLRARMLVYLVLILLLFSAVSYWSTHQLLTRSHLQHEQKFAESDLRRLQTLLRSQQQNLLHTLLDYSRWDDTLTYLHNRNASYLKNNYTGDSLSNLGIDLVLLISNDFEVLESLQLQGGHLQPLADGDPLWLQIQQLLKLRTRPELEDGLKLLLWSQGQAVQAAIGPITDSEQRTPTAGWLLFARHLDKHQQERLQQESGVTFSLQANSAELPASSDERIVASEVLQDSLGSSDVRLLISRPLSAQSHLALAEHLQLGNSLLILFLSTLSVALLLERLVLRRLSRLQRDAHLHHPPAGETIEGDELEQLSRSLNNTLHQLQQAHRDLYAEVRRDALTGLGNRKAFDECLLLFQALQQRHDAMRTTLYLFDLDNFKLANDCLGHDAGDRILQQIAQRIRGIIRSCDSAIRLGGDEFAILSISDCTEMGMQTFAERLLETIRQPLLIDGIRMTLSASMGIADSSTGMSQDQLLRNADIAMYQAKSSGKGGFAFFSAQMHEEVRERMSIEQELRQALANGQLEVWFQPIVDANSGAPCMLEALARWPRQGKMFPPDKFIPVAEESGLIDELGLYIARNAITTLSRLLAVQPGLKMNINLSVKQMLQDDLSSQLCSLVDGAQTPRNLVHFELTESAFADHQQYLEQQLFSLASAGFDLHMDDFGTGYSSLQRLQSLPMSALKLEKSFTRQLGQGDERIARVILSLGEQLQMQVIAEGVETETERRRLQELGCQFMQGYLFAKPMPEQELTAWLQQQAAAKSSPGMSRAS